LSLPHGGHRQDIIRKKAFEDYIRDHVASWFAWTQDNKLGVERIEDLILVSGCTLATSWAVAAFVDNTMEAEISLASRTLGDNGGANFVWSNMQGPVRYKNSRFNPVSLPPVRFPWHALIPFVCCMESKIHQRLRISASSSGVSEQSASSSGPGQSKLPQNLLQTTLTTAERMRYK
jgi:hypothetical protein